MEVCYKCKLVIEKDEKYIYVPVSFGNRNKLHVECYEKSRKNQWIGFGIIILVMVIFLIIVLTITL